jgi:hypothetical protein
MKKITQISEEEVQCQKWEYNETVRLLFIDFKKAYDSMRRDVLYNILIEFGVPMKLARLIKMCLNETYIKASIDKRLSECFLIQDDLKTRRCSITTAFHLA